MEAIGVISDTHGLLRPEVRSMLHGVNHIIHAGDIGDPGLVGKLAEIAPVSAIRGNIDSQAWATDLPDVLRLKLFGKSILVVHDRNKLGRDLDPSGFDLVVSGHSHRAGIEVLGTTTYLNPGSAGPRRFKLPITLATVAVGEDGRFECLVHSITET